MLEIAIICNFFFVFCMQLYISNCTSYMEIIFTNCNAKFPKFTTVKMPTICAVTNMMHDSDVSGINWFVHSFAQEFHMLHFS